MQLNASRIKFLQAQDDVVVAMKDAARKELLNISSNRKTYKDLIQSLVVQVHLQIFLFLSSQTLTIEVFDPTVLNLQSLLKLNEPSVVLRCREIDLTLVESVIEEAKRSYVTKSKLSAPKINIDRNVFLPPPPSNKDPNRPSW